MKTTVLSLGGSIIVPEKIDTKFLSEFKQLILAHIDKGHRFIIVCGGGKVCREYQNAAVSVSNVDNVDLDWIGILATKLNAELIRGIFSKQAFQRVLNNPQERLVTDRKIIIASGYMPGNSSDRSAVELAENFGAKRVINMSNIDMVYNKDPKHHKDAKPIKKITWTNFLKLTGEKWIPGKNVPFDPVASKIAKKLGIEVNVMGKDLKNFKKCLDGKKFVGTIIKG
jgi:uridylate kinase